MNIAEIIRDIEDHQCGSCKIGLALKALHERQVELKPAQPQPTKAPEKVCKICRRAKRIDEFDKAKACKDGHLGSCKECRRERQRKPKTKGAKGSVEMLRPSIEKIEAETRKLKSSTPEFYCQPCHCTFATKQALEAHNCVAKKAV